MSFRYDTREAWLGALSEEAVPAAYDLCGTHADKTRPPHGWGLVDQRPDDEPEGDAPKVNADELGGEETVAVLAAALRSVPSTPRPEPVQPETPVVEAPAPVDTDDEVREALAELQSVVTRDDTDLEPILLDQTLEDLVEQQEQQADLDEDPTDTVAQVEQVERATAEPRPVPAAQRRDRPGAAQHW